jgi:exodeoxyribonuclease V alpha subunit
MITLQGHLERIAYQHERTHYTIGKLRVDETHNMVSVVGYMAGAQPGDILRLKGGWETHEKYGPQFRAASVEIVPGDPLDSIRKFLASGFIKGIGPKLTGKLLSHFEADILNVLDSDPNRLCEVSGISAAKAEGISDAWRTHHGARRAMMFLQAFGVKPFHCARILNVLGPDAVEIIKQDPYRLSTDVHEIDFFLADRLAIDLGVEPDDLRRLQACLLYLMEQSIAQGDTFADRNTLMARCAKLTQVDETPVATALDSLVSAGMLVAKSIGGDPPIEAVYLTAFHAAEIGIANRITALLSVPMPPDSLDPDQITSEVVRRLAIKPSDGQLAVLSEISSHRAIIITGGPGTGKTTLIRSVCAVFGAVGKRICLAAPTGRAARRLSEVTGRKAATIHKLLGYHLEEAKFEKDENNPIEADVVIVDETSMVDTLLMFSLLRAVPMTAVLVFVGDVFQLPPVGPGNVLSDLIDSGRIRTFELNEIFRQAQESPIIVNAHRVRAGRMPVLDSADPELAETEFYFMEQTSPAAVVETVVRLCAEIIPRCFRLDPIRDVQVLTPMHKGEGGTLNLNQVLQAALNKSREATAGKGRVFRLGDKVMHLKNNYQKEVFNGDIGTVCEIDNEEEELLVDYDGRDVAYGYDELEELSLAYAITVHKSQGSEYPAVVVPMMTQHYVLLQRNLLYTALTRGQRLVFLVGSRNAVEIALHNDKPRQRLSGLCHWLKISF